MSYIEFNGIPWCRAKDDVDLTERYDEALINGMKPIICTHVDRVYDLKNLYPEAKLVVRRGPCPESNTPSIWPLVIDMICSMALMVAAVELALKGDYFAAIAFVLITIQIARRTSYKKEK